MGAGRANSHGHHNRQPENEDQARWTESTKSSWSWTRFACIGGALFVLGLIVCNHPSSHEKEVRRIRQLLNSEFVGLDPVYAQTIQPKDIRPYDHLRNLPVEERNLSVDFRTLKIADQTTRTKAWGQLYGFSLNSQTNAENNEYRGNACLAHYPGQICPVPVQCPPPNYENPDAVELIDKKGACIHWKEGILPNFALPLGPINNFRTTNKWDIDGQWKGDDWLPNKPEQSEKFRFFTPNDMHQCLAGKRILFSGDSMIRQLFNRLINYSRQIPTLIEQHYYGAGSVYTVYNDGTDHWEIWRDPNDAVYSREKDDKDGVLYRIFWNWQFEPLHQIELMFQPLAVLDVDLAVLGLNYHYPRGFDYTVLPSYFDTFWESNWPGLISWYASPEEYSGKDSWWHTGKNAIMRSLVADRSTREGRKVHILPSDRIIAAADAQQYPVRNCRRDKYMDWELAEGSNQCLHDAHFQCGFMSMYNETVPPGVDGFKAPPGVDCRDIFNLNLLQVWLNSVCPI